MKYQLRSWMKIKYDIFILIPKISKEIIPLSDNKTTSRNKRIFLLLALKTNDRAKIQYYENKKRRIKAPR